MVDDEYSISEKELIQININDMLTSLGWQEVKFARNIIETVFRRPASMFARQVLDFDRGVRDLGLVGGGQRLLRSYVNSFSVLGAENIPIDGPVLILSNHPGMTDTVALFAALPRNDLRVLAAERPFLKALPATRPYLIFIPEGEGRSEPIRQAGNHLRQGGAILTFPSGQIDPDPSSMPGVIKALSNWSPSMGIFIRLVPNVKVLPVIVSGVIAPQSLRHPFTRFRRQTQDRQRLAATLQILTKVFLPDIWPVNVQVDIFPSIPGEDLLSDPDPKAITRAIIEKVTQLYKKVSNH